MIRLLLNQFLNSADLLIIWDSNKEGSTCHAEHAYARHVPHGPDDRSSESIQDFWYITEDVNTFYYKLQLRV